jgi:hypothetical protein
LNLVNIRSPKLELSLFSKTAVNVLGHKRIQDLLKSRTRLLRFIHFFILPDCPTSNRLLGSISPQIANLLVTSNYGSGPLLSLVDVMELQTARYLVPIHEVFILFYFVLCSLLFVLCSLFFVFVYFVIGMN